MPHDGRRRSLPIGCGLLPHLLRHGDVRNEVGEFHPQRLLHLENRLQGGMTPPALQQADVVSRQTGSFGQLLLAQVRPVAPMRQSLSER